MTFTRRVERRRAVMAMLTVCFYALPGLGQDAIDPSIFSGLEWRLIGPYRGGRVTAVTGVADRPMLYYASAAGGGEGAWRRVEPLR